MSAVSHGEELSMVLLPKNLPDEVSVAITEKVETVVQTCLICAKPASGRQFRHTDAQGVNLHPDAVMDETCMNEWRTYNNICPFCRAENPQTIVPQANPQAIVPQANPQAIVPQENVASQVRERSSDYNGWHLCCNCCGIVFFGLALFLVYTEGGHTLHS